MEWNDPFIFRLSAIFNALTWSSMARVETWLAFAQPLLTRTVDTQFEETTVEDQLEQATKKEKENV